MYKTKTTPALVLDVNKDGDSYVVTLTGDRTKELLRTPVRRAARTYYDNLVKHYEQRAKDEA